MPHHSTAFPNPPPQLSQTLPSVLSRQQQVKPQEFLLQTTSENLPHKAVTSGAMCQVCENRGSKLKLTKKPLS